MTGNLELMSPYPAVFHGLTSNNNDMNQIVMGDSKITNSRQLEGFLYPIDDTAVLSMRYATSR